MVAALAKKYQPQDTITRVELRQKLNKIKMKKNEDPAKLFEQISQIENKYNTAAFTIDSANLIAVVLDAASEKSVRLPTFDGANKNYQLWWTRRYGVQVRRSPRGGRRS